MFKCCCCKPKPEQAMDPLVTVEQGRIKGRIDQNLQGREYYSFLGIPYAKPPLGELRFKDPVPPEPWDGIRDGTVEGQPCYAKQYEVTPKGMTLTMGGSENCLILNVFTPKLPRVHPVPTKNLMPVMLWIHGGAFTMGSGGLAITGPQYFMTEDVVLVSINYRLGCLGFLSLNDLGIGNAGMKDMIQSLKWVQRNIKEFGGNPDCVTIFGESAGGAAIHYLVLSPLAKGLFHRAIAQSGSAVNLWSRGKEDNGFTLAKILGCNEKDPQKVFDFLQSQTEENLNKGQRELGDSLDISKHRIFSPVHEKPSSTAFLYEDVFKLLKSGHYNQVPLMMGFNNSEGLVMPFAQQAGLNVSTEFVPYILGYEPDGSDHKNMKKKIMKQYFQGGEYNADDLETVAHLYTDCEFLRGINQAVKAHSKSLKEPLYYYRMDIESKLNFTKMATQATIPGACHADDLGYLFRYEAAPIPIEPNSPEDIGIQRFIKFWTNFARSGNPNPKDDPLFPIEWKSVQKQGNRLNCMAIDTEIKMVENPREEHMKFWDTVYKDHPEDY